MSIQNIKVEVTSVNLVHLTSKDPRALVSFSLHGLDGDRSVHGIELSFPYKGQSVVDITDQATVSLHATLHEVVEQLENFLHP